MSYTLAMATDQEPKIAEDGVQDVPLTIARPLLTRLIEQVREDGLVSALTVRGRRRAYLVSPDAYLRAQVNGQAMERVRRLANDAAFMARVQELDPDFHLLLETDSI